MILIRTSQGRAFDIEHAEARHIDPRDIARGLSHVCRYTGQTPYFYSVAQHSIMVMALVDWELQAHALHHDDTEAYMGDLSRNLKHHPLLEGYRLLEERLDRVIHERFGLRPLTTREQTHLKAADDLAAIYERWALIEQQPWANPDEILMWAERENFVQSNVAMMAAMLPRVHFAAGIGTALPHSVAEALYLKHYHRLSIEQQTARAGAAH